jgi:hypothetical protein
MLPEESKLILLLRIPQILQLKDSSENCRPSQA